MFEVVVVKSDVVVESGGGLEGVACACGDGVGEEGVGLSGQSNVPEVVEKVVGECVPGTIGEGLESFVLGSNGVRAGLNVGGLPGKGGQAVHVVEWDGGSKSQTVGTDFGDGVVVFLYRRRELAVVGTRTNEHTKVKDGVCEFGVGKVG